MNWYRVLTQHDDLRKGDMVLLPGGAREASLELIGYLKFVGVAPDPDAPPPQPPDVQPEFLALEPGTKEEATTPRRGRRGKSSQDRPAEVESVGPVSGDESRGEDSSAD